MVFGIYIVSKDNGMIIKFIEKNALKMEDYRNNTYYLWSDKGNLHRIKYNHFACKRGGEYTPCIEIDSTPPDAKIPEKLEELLKKHKLIFST